MHHAHRAANPPLHGLYQNRISCAFVNPTAEITARMWLLALTNTRRRKPKRMRLFSIAADLTRHSPATVLTLNQKQPWTRHALHAIIALREATDADG